MHKSSRPFRLLAAVLTVALAAMLMVVGAAQAGAVPTGNHTNRVVSDDPANNTPRVKDGYVASFAQVGDVMVVGGNFTAVAAASDPDTNIARSHLFAFNIATGQLTSLAPELNGEVTDVESAGDGQSVWIAGGFSSLNGQTVRSLARIDLNSGQRLTSFNPPSFDGRIHDMELRHGKLYLMGRFLNAGNQPRPLLAAVDATTGALDADVSANFTDPRSNGSLSILAGDMSPDGTKLVAIGNFTKVNGQTRYQIAVLDIAPSAPAGTNRVTVANWATGLYGDGCSSSFQSYMRDVDISPDGTYFVVATTGAYNTSLLCDTVARWDFSRTGSSLTPEWTNYSGGDTFTAVGIAQNVVYVGGHQNYVNNPYLGDGIGAGAVRRDGLAALDPRSGATLNWDPSRERGYGVYGFEITDTGLWIGSDTTFIGKENEPRDRLAFMPLATGTTLPADWAGELPAQVVSLGVNRPLTFGASLDRVSTRTLSATGTATSPEVISAGTVQWRNLRGAFMIDGKLYTGWSDGTFKVQTYDGTTFGPQTNIPLALGTNQDTGAVSSNSLNRFSTQDLATMTGMFYDPVMGRMYFTKSGSNVLSYRSFSSESNIVGAARVDSATGAGGVTWTNVRSMFLANGKLFTSDSNGNLTRRNWNSATGLPVSGSSAVVSGPSTGDGLDWRARDAFVYAEANHQTPNALPTANFTASCAGALCSFTSTSSDPDGSIVDWSWDFGDGTSAGIGANPTHIYAASGTKAVSLTVTDNRGATTTTTINVDVVVPNQAPVATITPSCAGLGCTFSGNLSVDPDGSIESYAWDFGDNQTDTGAVVPHTYAQAGTYPVTLTVTDNVGATGTATANVNVVDPNVTPTVTFRGASGADTNSLTPSVTIPAATQPGDLLVLVTSLNAAATTVTGPAGWTLVESGSNPTADIQTRVWSKVAGASDAGSTVQISQAAYFKASMQVLAYGGASGIAAHQIAFNTASTVARTTPGLNVTKPGSTVVSYWSDRTSGNTGWTVPETATVRNQTVGTGGGHMTSAIADTASVATGPAGGITANAAVASTRAVTATLVIEPEGTPNAAPTAAIVPNCQNLTCGFDGSSSTDDAGVVSWVWNYGDNTSGVGAVAPHTYANAGTYTVKLTVTDAVGVSNTATTQVTVNAPAPQQIVFRANAESQGNSLTQTVQIPPSVQPGDRLVLVSAQSRVDVTVNGPAGWTWVNSGSDAGTSVQTHAWTKVATAADAGANVSITNSDITKTTLSVVAYSGVGSISAQNLAFDAALSATHTTPTVSVASNASTVLSIWTDRTSTNTGWTLPASVTLRSQVAGAGSGHMTTAIGSTSSVSTGISGGFTATSQETGRRTAMWSIVLAPGV